MVVLFVVSMGCVTTMTPHLAMPLLVALGLVHFGTMFGLHVVLYLIRRFWLFPVRVVTGLLHWGHLLNVFCLI